MHVEPLECGWIRQPGFALEDGATRDLIDIPVPAWLVRHPAGTVVFDTGMPAELIDSTEHLGPLAKLFTPLLDAEATVASRLEAVGIDPTGPLTVVLSHCHFDHAGGLGSLPNARVVVQRAEWRAAAGGDGLAYDARLYELGHDIVEVDGDHDLFDDGAVTCLSTPGHTAGHQSLRVRTDDGPVVLTADACYFARTLDGGPLPRFAHDHDQQARSLARLRAERAAGAIVHPGHDPEAWQRLMAP